MAPTIVVVGHGMVGHRFLEEAVARGLHETHRIVVLAEERRAAYDRVHLSSFFDGASTEDLALSPDEWFLDHGIELALGEPATELLVHERTIVTAAGRRIPYDACVLASGSSAFVPPIDGHDAAGCFVYRTLDDLEAIRAWASGASAGVVVGGGLLGLEAANAVRLLGLRTSVVEMAPRLMAVQLDDGGGRALRGHVDALGIEVHTGVAVAGVATTPDGRVAGLRLGGGEDAAERTLPAELVVFAAGIRPRDQLARVADLPVGERGGVVIDDRCATAAPGVYAIGEVACHSGRVYGLVAPGQVMAEVVADQIAGGGLTFAGADLSTRLKLLGVEVASVGNPHAEGHEIVVSDPLVGTWKRAVLDDEHRLVGAVLVGDAAPFGHLVSALRTGTAVTDALAMLSPPPVGGAAGPMADEASVCSCHNVCAGTIRGAVDDGHEEVPAVKACTKAGTGCGSCVPILQELIDEQLAASGRAVVRHLCPHFAMSRAELFDVVSVTGIRTFRELVERHGTGRGCEICKPAVASMFASLASGYILDGEQASLQDTNDHFLANLQRDGTYSVIPRIPGGEITPEKLIVIGEVARDFDLYTKITGGQRIDLLGARVDDLPAIWARLVAAGFESGHAYGKALRTVKSCVGTVWCRYGVQDSVQLAVDLELRYRGLRSPHKLKMAVSGCARECAEAQGKDVGVIATERGWNLYVGGNGGMRPAHAQLLAEDLDTETLVRSIDRYLMWYIRTADRLERTATWQRKLPGGIDQVRRVVMDDALGIGADLEADMARHVESYECEWTATLNDAERLSRFRSIVNDPEGAPLPTRVEIRGQRVPE
ncbi:MAG: nitrite reductase large subunit NirB [Acidimicrobiales bacterium]|nr:nitrite reductase large subunit NirB [Acidimicrobiales bacterium]